MEQANLFTEEAPVEVIETSLKCRRCGGKTKKLTIAIDFYHRLLDKFLCGRCKRMDEEGDGKLSYIDQPMMSGGPLLQFTYPPVITINPEKVVICRTKEEVHLINRSGLVGVLHPGFCL